MALQIHTAPPSSGDVVLDRTIIDLLDDAVARYPNEKAFNQPLPAGGWRTMSNGDLRDAVEEIALGLVEHGLAHGDRLAMFMNSDLHFALVDFGSLLAGLVNAPLYTTFARENLVYATRHSESTAMAVSNPEMLARFAEWAGDVPAVRLVVLAEGEPGDVRLPDGMRLVTMDALRAAGRARRGRDAGEAERLREAVSPDHIATIIYTSGTTGTPKGVMLTHENITSNVYASFTSFGILGHQEEVAVTFLPMTHILARMLQFAFVAWGHQLYYSDPERLVAHLAEVKPTIFASVPRVLEKVYDKVHLGVVQAEGLKKTIGSWALGLARQFETGSAPSGLYALKLGLADKLVYSKLRERLGLTRVKALVIGGAALRDDLANTFNAFQIPVYQGYGLTETSPVIAVCLPKQNRAGTVGPPIPGIEVAIAEDGEILTRGPHVMKGYYKDAEQTAEVIDADGWFHSGDIGDFTAEGFLRITDRKKSLFKLSTGKYVMPQPVENALMESPLVEQAVVMGSGQRFCSALVFPGMEAVRVWAKSQGIDTAGTDAELAREPRVVAEFERLVAEANGAVDHWSQVKRFRLVPEPMTVENELLTPSMKVKRSKVREVYEPQIEAMYAADSNGQREVAAVV